MIKATPGNDRIQLYFWLFNCLGKTSKFDKSVSPKKKKTPTKHQEINKTTLQSLFGKEPVKRSGVPKKETKVSNFMNYIFFYLLIFLCDCMF